MSFIHQQFCRGMWGLVVAWERGRLRWNVAWRGDVVLFALFRISWKTRHHSWIVILQRHFLCRTLWFWKKSSFLCGLLWLVYFSIFVHTSLICVLLLESLGPLLRTLAEPRNTENKKNCFHYIYIYFFSSDLVSVCHPNVNLTILIVFTRLCAHSARVLCRCYLQWRAFATGKSDVVHRSCGPRKTWEQSGRWTMSGPSEVFFAMQAVRSVSP